MSGLRQLVATTPGLYRLLSIVTSLLLLVLAVVATFAAQTAQSASRDMRRNTAPVLVATQSLLASLAEADAAATAALLTGANEDREQRRLYEEALARANAQSEEISALIGDDADAHDHLKRLGVRVTQYAGLIEAARASVKAGVPGGEQYLLSALDLLAAGIRDDVARLTAASEARLDRDEARRGRGVLPAVAVGVVALAGLLMSSVVMTRRSHRLVNPLLAIAGFAVVAVVSGLVFVHARATDDIDVARGRGYEAIALTATIQTEAFGGKTDESVSLISADPSRRVSADAAAGRLTGELGVVTEEVVAGARDGSVAGGGLLAASVREADSARERAAAAELLVRWQRYRDAVDRLRAAPPDQARALAVGPVSSTFNGFNFSVESVLAQNRDQFLEGVAAADDRAGGVAIVTILLPLVAMLAALGGFQVRINEYR